MRLIFINQWNKTEALAELKEKLFYLTIDIPSVAEYKDRGSRFIAYAYPLQLAVAFKPLLQNLKKEHPKAVHHCFAWRIGIDGNNFRASDDGEPSGTAGKPILGQIDSKGLTDIAVIIVRYFGGTLLGVTGLIHAYKTAASLSLQVVPQVQKPVEIHYKIQFDYTRMNEVMMVLKQNGCRIIDNEMQLFCMINVAIPINRVQEVVNKLIEISGIEIGVNK